MEDRVHYRNLDVDRNLGQQPIAKINCENNLIPQDLVAASAAPLTHKMVSRACKGRRLTLDTQSKVLAALNRAAGQNFALGDLFDY